MHERTRCAKLVEAPTLVQNPNPSVPLAGAALFATRALASLMAMAGPEL